MCNVSESVSEAKGDIEIIRFRKIDTLILTFGEKCSNVIFLVPLHYTGQRVPLILYLKKTVNPFFILCTFISKSVPRC